MLHISTAARGARAALALLAFALVALASAPAHAGADPGESKPTGTPANAALGSDQAPDRSARGAANASPAAARALNAIQRRIANYVERHGTKYTFATHLDSDTGRIVLDSDAPASVMAGLTSMSDPDQRREVGRAQVRRATISDTWNRRDDIPAFWGGAGITNAGGICSAGYAVRNSFGSVFSVTAGHCFAPPTARPAGPSRTPPSPRSTASASSPADILRSRTSGHSPDVRVRRGHRTRSRHGPPKAGCAASSSGVTTNRA